MSGQLGYDDSNYLYHHGILGQRWGVRRYQNGDGSLTSAGRARYGKFDRIRDRILYGKERQKKIEERVVGGKSKTYARRLAAVSKRSTGFSMENRYGKNGVKRIKDRMAKGQTKAEAVRKEFYRQALVGTAVVAGSAATAYFLGKYGAGKYYDWAKNNAAAKEAASKFIGIAQNHKFDPINVKARFV